MHSTDRQVLEAARRWAAAGHRFALVTVARTWGSSPRPAQMAQALDYQVFICTRAANTPARGTSPARRCSPRCPTTRSSS